VKSKFEVYIEFNVFWCTHIQTQLGTRYNIYTCNNTPEWTCRNVITITKLWFSTQSSPNFSFHFSYFFIFSAKIFPLMDPWTWNTHWLPSVNKLHFSNRFILPYYVGKSGMNMLLRVHALMNRFFTLLSWIMTCSVKSFLPFTYSSRLISLTF